MSFFDEPEPEPELEPAAAYRTPPWLAPPENVIPATVALDVVLVRRPDLAIWVTDALAPLVTDARGDERCPAR